MQVDWDDDAERACARHHKERRRLEIEQARSYIGLTTARRAAGVARIVQGLHLVSLHDTGGWKGKTGATSFRGFLQEEGIEPRAAYQYMAVARSFVLEHAVQPERIALAGMRLLVEAGKYLRHDEPEQGFAGTVDEVVDIVTTLPAAEAHEALRERFGTPQSEPASADRLAPPVCSILDRVSGLTFEQKAQLYRVLRASPETTARAVAANDISDTTEA